tara:strand:+ start:1733 stop:2485 length:753 start_codon:yes stop_codon:yes gene_type:complete
MISELKLIIFTGAIYFLLEHFKLFKIVDGMMKGQDKLIIMAVKVIGVLVLLHFLVQFSKSRTMIEGATNNSNGMESIINTLKESIPLVGDKKDEIKHTLTGIINDINPYGDNNTCNIILGEKKDNYDRKEIKEILRCILFRITICPDIVESITQGRLKDITDQCLVDFIENNSDKFSSNLKEAGEEYLKNYWNSHGKRDSQIIHLLMNAISNKEKMEYIKKIIEIENGVLSKEERDHLKAIQKSLENNDN